MSYIATAKSLKLISKRYKVASKVLQHVEEKHVTVTKAVYQLDMKASFLFTSQLIFIIYFPILSLTDHQIRKFPNRFLSFI